MELDNKAVSGITLVLLTSMLMLKFNIQPIKAMPAIIVVPDNYPTIQQAINAASAGDTIFVKAGMYYENVVVDKPVSLLGEDTQNTIIDGKGAGTVVKIAVNGVNVSGFTIRKSGYPQSGLLLYYVSGCSINGNIITANRYCGIYLYSSSNNTISGNIITANDHGGIMLYGSSKNSISRNGITANNGDGVLLSDSSNYNSIFENNVVNNPRGIYISHSSNNDVSENNITNNDCGVRLDLSSNNKFYHNNFIDNAKQVNMYAAGYANVWDDSYPSGGNYWSDYRGVDADDDCVGDQPYTIDADNADRYPFIGLINIFDVSVQNGTAHSVGIVSNSTVLNFKLDMAEKAIRFNVTGLEGAAGFCRVTIPNLIVQELWQSNYMVLLNGEQWPFKNWTDNTNTYIYINYAHAEHEITIIPEFPSTIILSLFILNSLIATILLKKEENKNQGLFPYFIYSVFAVIKKIPSTSRMKLRNPKKLVNVPRSPALVRV
ncbi:MAG: NosD domain-containing protein [Candidatus Bathyarchaeia archaeon]